MILKNTVITLILLAVAACGAEPGEGGHRGVPDTSCEVVKADGCTTIDCGTDTATVCDGEDGADGVDGQDGLPGQPGQDGTDATLPRHPCLDTPYLDDPLFESCTASLDFLTWEFSETRNTCHAVNFDNPSVDHTYDCGEFPTILDTVTTTLEAIPGGCIIEPLATTWFDVDALEPPPLTWSAAGQDCNVLSDGSLYCSDNETHFCFVAWDPQDNSFDPSDDICVWIGEGCSGTLEQNVAHQHQDALRVGQGAQ